MQWPSGHSAYQISGDGCQDFREATWPNFGRVRQDFREVRQDFREGHF